MNICSTRLLLPLIAAAAFVLPAQAGQRRFAYNYETTTQPKGAWDIENWITFERSPLHDNDFNAFSFRHEIEYGVTDRLQLAIYVANWDFAPRGGGDEEEEAESGGGEVEAEGVQADVEEKGESDHGKKKGPRRSARYESTSVELIYNLTNPNTDWLGSALYFEAGVGDRLVELEGKILLQKNFGRFMVVYNAFLEAEFEGAHLDEQKAEFGQTLGVSYQVHPNVSVGGELVHEIEFPDWNTEKAERAELFVGPNVAFRIKNFFAAAAALWRTTDNAGAEDMQARLIVGFDF